VGGCDAMSDSERAQEYALLATLAFAKTDGFAECLGCLSAARRCKARLVWAYGSRQSRPRAGEAPPPPPKRMRERQEEYFDLLRRARRQRVLPTHPTDLTGSLYGRRLRACAKRFSSASVIEQAESLDPGTNRYLFASLMKASPAAKLRRRRKPGVSIFETHLAPGADVSFADLERADSASFTPAWARSAGTFVGLRPRPHAPSFRTGALNLPWQPREKDHARFHRCVFAVALIAWAPLPFLRDSCRESAETGTSQSPCPYQLFVG